jgi:hypothetical protein
MDKGWWDKYLTEVNEVFCGRRFSTNNFPAMYKIIYIPNFKSYQNSGANAISLALHGGAKKVVLLGYDCQKTEGMSHWHGDHPRGLHNAKQIDRWPELFKRLRDDNPDSEIVNASRQTALDMFPKIPIERVLC